MLVTFNLVTISFQFYCEKLRIVLNLKCSDLKITMSFEPQHVSSIICKLVKFKIAEIHIPDAFVFTFTLELSSTLKSLHLSILCNCSLQEEHITTQMRKTRPATPGDRRTMATLRPTFFSSEKEKWK